LNSSDVTAITLESRDVRATPHSAGGSGLLGTPVFRRRQGVARIGMGEIEVYMRLSLAAALAVFLLPLSAAAGENAPKAEAFGGYSYFRPVDPGGADLHGWNGSFNYNVTDWLGATADFSGHYGSPLDFRFASVDSREHLFLFGPKLAARGNSRWTPFAQALFGVANSRLGAFGLGLSDNAFAMAAGGGLDYRVSKNFAVRLVQADYLHTRFDRDKQHNLRLSAGIVWRLGSR
jgi:opacity protein-like surface antigen